MLLNLCDVFAKWRLNWSIRSGIRHTKALRKKLIQKPDKMAEYITNPAKALVICNELIPAFEKALRTYNRKEVTSIYEETLLPKMDELEALNRAQTGGDT